MTEGRLIPDEENAYQLVFDANRNVTKMRINIKKEGYYAFFTEHMPFEFEADEHFLKMSLEKISNQPLKSLKQAIMIITATVGSMSMYGLIRKMRKSWCRKSRRL